MPIVEAMACGTPVVASSHPSMDEASGEVAVRADPDDPAAIAAAVEAAVDGGGSLTGRCSPRSPLHLAWRGRGDAARLRGGGSVKIGIDVTPLVQTGAGTARHVRGLLAALEGRPGLELHRLAFGGTGRATTIARDAAWYPIGIGHRREISTCSTARLCVGLCVPAPPSS